MIAEAMMLKSMMSLTFLDSDTTTIMCPTSPESLSKSGVFAAFIKTKV